MIKQKLAQQLSNKIAYENSIVMEPKHCEQVINALTEIIKDEVLTGGRVDIRGFGSFFGKQMAETTARNFGTGERMIIPAKLKVVFKPSKIHFVIKD